MEIDPNLKTIKTLEYFLASNDIKNILNIAY